MRTFAQVSHMVYCSGACAVRPRRVDEPGCTIPHSIGTRGAATRTRKLRVEIASPHAATRYGCSDGYVYKVPAYMRY